MENKELEIRASTVERTSSVADDAAAATRDLGIEIRRARIERSLTLSDLASKTGLSVSMLSMLERGKTGVSVGTLVALASALGVPVSDLFRDTRAAETALTRVEDQSEITIGSGVVRRLVVQDRERGIEVTMLQIPSGDHTGLDPIRHEGHEYVTVLEGTVVVEVGDQSHTLREGDALQLDAQNLHRFANNAAVTARMMLVLRISRPVGLGH